MANVLIVGAGPGAVDLLTLRAARALGEADEALADGLVGADVLALAKSGTTLVIHLGLARLLNIVARLIAAGLPPDTPAAAITSGPTDMQGHLAATLAELPARVAAEGFASPAIVVIGDVAALAGIPARRAA
ncbi:SAM-dependent methyltransferase [Aromatoleum bremense]|uniref:uroporphyrinogen-III C-methyltransferase n=1 Tax=Aromatoleum bremense TaxID=76115 RepID=A0ABX1NQS5_9RHOO|nr:SAM-dependent methyltransferase [Aromatoleum bremense]NMG14338.1 hypothetical protein [Aromatoleum bremense]QTQ31070.1 Uroporphyrinogen-III C-methyltransferase domain-containing protein [Aromatoleum bremense]